ncbi:hypothetical protein NBRGN_043_00610 [Nocardia brasiliensis NBRC 14402]|uniref:hypothetical protein n=1 Tax=Nocardia brasiliensis TaxID=37326 RepID=UPI0002E8BCA1|nr:hypothetical protein [Nocardia brasiliensis]ASF10366.1 hypothetical protein CEQ30_26680 [Nocardia brasiliensis]MBF6124824.1 hypothetical protein [Nocardia brasiliensis]GAJ81751.1 hypothetical protein NBRGN_043_00610 [Nocardia brasiliensis NBRC 14402]SUB11157.1 Uncharacterised protein [Nocardia brasiliensis]
MTLWLTALLVWMAAGARVGRVLVKPATTARVAIVIAVAAVALAATVAVPEIAVAIDNLLPGGVHAGWLSDGVVVSAWIAFVTATSVVASAAWPVVSRRNLRQVALVIYSLGLFAVAATIAWSFTFGWEVVAFGAVFIVITGLRNLDWTTLGRGIAIYTTGTAVVAVLAVLQVRRAFNDAPRVAPGNPTWAWPAWEAASLLIAFGAVWIVVELWVRARVLLRQIRLLHKIMVGRFPEVVAHDQTGTSTQLRASDQVAQIMDALYLQSGGGVVLAAVAPPPRSIAERAGTVAEWARNPLGDVAIDARWIAPPEGISPRGWVQAIARAYDATSLEHARN